MYQFSLSWGTLLVPPSVIYSQLVHNYKFFLFRYLFFSLYPITYFFVLGYPLGTIKCYLFSIHTQLQILLVLGYPFGVIKCNLSSSCIQLQIFFCWDTCSIIIYIALWLRYLLVSSNYKNCSWGTIYQYLKSSKAGQPLVYAKLFSIFLFELLNQCFLIIVYVCEVWLIWLRSLKSLIFLLSFWDFVVFVTILGRVTISKQRYTKSLPNSSMVILLIG